MIDPWSQAPVLHYHAGTKQKRKFTATNINETAGININDKDTMPQP